MAGEWVTIPWVWCFTASKHVHRPHTSFSQHVGRTYYHPISQLRKWRHREGKQCKQGHTAGGRQSQELPDTKTSVFAVPWASLVAVLLSRSPSNYAFLTCPVPGMGLPKPGVRLGLQRLRSILKAPSGKHQLKWNWKRCIFQEYWQTYDDIR